MTGYVINYLTAVCHMLNRKGGKWPWDFNAWENACCEFLNRPKPLMLKLISQNEYERELATSEDLKVLV